MVNVNFFTAVLMHYWNKGIRFMNKTLKIIGGLFAVFLFFIGGAFIYLSTFLPAVDDAPELTIEISTERIERGKYLANHVYVCMDCHSDRDNSKFAYTVDENTLGKGGYLFGIDQGFPGNYYAKNLTPYNLGSWTDGEIFRAITAGVDNEGSAMFPIMHYNNYSQVDKEDIFDIVAYLRSLEPIEYSVPESRSPFPMSLIINTMPADPAFTAKPSVDDPVAHGKYLVTAASCAECHTPMNDKGQRLEGKDFAGGMPFSVPGGTVYSANITPDTVTGIGNWSEEMFVQSFKRFQDPTLAINTVIVASGTFNSSMPWRSYSAMSEAELKSIYAYLRTLKPVEYSTARFLPISE